MFEMSCLLEVSPILAFIYSTFCLRSVFGSFDLDIRSLYLRRDVFSRDSEKEHLYTID
jgi:hypothetical protein